MTAAVALAFFVVYAAVAFGWRSLLQWRRTGSTGIKGLSGRPLSAEWAGGALFAVAMTAFPTAALLALSGVFPALALPFTLSVIGGGLAAIGFGATVWSQLSMGTSWRIGVDANEQTLLVRNGAFAVVRNPIFSAMVIASIGFVLLVPNIVALTALLALVVAVELQVRLVEEPSLLRTHGAGYAGYAAAVGRFVPGLGRLSPSR